MMLSLGLAAVGTCWWAMTVARVYQLRAALRLPKAVPDAGAGSSGLPRCSVIIPARDEADRIGESIRRLLMQEGVELEIIVVDDRSTDGTGGIARQVAAGDGRVRVVTVDTLPAGWLGKCHACHVGAAAATGEWILFTDADCWPASDVIARALGVAKADGVDHVTLTPGVRVRTVWAGAWHLNLALTLVDRISGVNRDVPGAHIGVGAFNLVRVGLYRKSGGYEALRLTVVDDLKLGLLLRRAGGRTRAFLGGEDAECEWGSTLRGAFRLMEKNYFAATDYRTGRALGAGFLGLLLWVSAVAGPWTGTPGGAWAALGLLSQVWPAWVLARRLGWSWVPAVLAPLVFAVLLLAILNSTFVTLRRGGVRWRDTFYSLDELRRGNVPF